MCAASSFVQNDDERHKGFLLAEPIFMSSIRLASRRRSDRTTAGHTQRCALQQANINLGDLS